MFEAAALAEQPLRVGDHVTLVAYGHQREGQVMELRGATALVEYEITGRGSWRVTQGWRPVGELKLLKRGDPSEVKSQQGFGAMLCTELLGVERRRIVEVGKAARRKRPKSRAQRSRERP